MTVGAAVLGAVWTMNLKEVNPLNIFHRIVDTIFALILLMITCGVAIGMPHLFKTVGFLMINQEPSRDYKPSFPSC